MGDLKTFVKKTVMEILQTLYPSMDKMHSIAAKVTDVQQQGDLRKYTVKPLSGTGNTDTAQMSIPNLLSDQTYQKGDDVIIQYVDGRYPYIIGRWYG